MIYRFIGTETEIAGVCTLTRFGQSVDLDPELAAEAVEGGAPILPEALFSSVGFTAGELDRFAEIGSHFDAPAEFLAKKKAALLKMHEWRELGSAVEGVMEEQEG